jgi:multidrug efflux pump subunit AcrB
MARLLLPESHDDHIGTGRWAAVVRAFDARFEQVKESYRFALAKFIARRNFSLACVAILILSSLAMLLVVGEDFFPRIDAGMMSLHLRMPTGTRVEHTEYVVDNIERAIRTVVPADELEGISDNIGLPISYDLAFYHTDSIGPQDADLLIQLKPEHKPTADYQNKIRSLISRQFPNVTAYFQAADIVSQVLNFGLPAAIDAQINGNNLQADYDIALRLQDRMRRIPGVSDLRIAEPQDYPTFGVNVDRDKALQLGITQQQVASSMLSTLSGASLLQPNFWLDPKSGVNYNVVAQAPQHLIDSVATLSNIPLSTPNITAGTQSQAQLLGNLATVTHTWDPAVVAHYTVQRVIDVDAAVEGRDLGSVTSAVQHEIDNLGPLPAGTHVVIRGQSQAMHDSFRTLGEGLILAIVLVYLLMVANFQSWLEPFIIMMAVPGALAGVLWMLAITGTTINVESLMGAIMAVGVGVANGNLLITFANELREDGYSPLAAAIEAGRIRFRPIIMTALAMILGMLPMALSLGSGSEQNAPLGRAVIGGLFAATMMTLFVVPAVYSIFGRSLIGKHQRDQEIEAITLPGA